MEVAKRSHYQHFLGVNIFAHVGFVSSILLTIAIIAIHRSKFLEFLSNPLGNNICKVGSRTQQNSDSSKFA